jgi:hypothetical protein
MIKNNNKSLFSIAKCFGRKGLTGGQILHFTDIKQCQVKISCNIIYVAIINDKLISSQYMKYI